MKYCTSTPHRHTLRCPLPPVADSCARPATHPLQPLTLHTTTRGINDECPRGLKIGTIWIVELCGSSPGSLAVTTTLARACREAREPRSGHYGVKDDGTADQMADEELARCRTDGRAKRRWDILRCPPKDTTIALTPLLPPCPIPIFALTASSKPSNHHHVYASLLVDMGILVFLYTAGHHIRRRRSLSLFPSRFTTFAGHTTTLAFVVNIGGRMFLLANLPNAQRCRQHPTHQPTLHNGMWDDATVSLICLPNPTVSS